MGRYSGPERRKYMRLPFQKTVKYRICYDKFSSAAVDADSQNIGGGGIMFKTKWPPPIMSIIAVDIDITKLKNYISKDNLKDKFNLDELYIQNGKLFGEVKRIKEYPESGYYDVALQLIHISDKKPLDKIKKLKQSPQQQQFPQT